MNRDDVFKFLLKWLSDESGLVVVKANQKGPRPARPYISLRFLNASQRVGSMDQNTTTEHTLAGETKYSVATEGMRTAVASINVFGDNAIDTLAMIRDSLDRPDVIDRFESAGVSHISEGPINDLTELLETIYEERGQMDLTIGFVAANEVEYGIIQSAEVNRET